MNPESDRRRWEPSAELFGGLLAWIESGRTLRAWCRQEGCPSYGTVYRWLAADKELQRQFDEAKQIGGQQLLEEVLEIADTPQVGEIVTEETRTITVDGKEIPETHRTVRREDMLGHRKLQCWAREKLLKVWFPEVFAERSKVQHSGKVTLEDLLQESRAEPTE